MEVMEVMEVRGVMEVMEVRGEMGEGLVIGVGLGRRGRGGGW
jgi:hypothetical protein